MTETINRTISAGEFFKSSQAEALVIEGTFDLNQGVSARLRAAQSPETVSP